MIVGVAQIGGAVLQRRGPAEGTSKGEGMSEVGGAREVNVSFGDVEGSQLVFGDHNVIQTPDGARVTFLHVGERPVPRLRRLPLSYAGHDDGFVGRKEELRLAAAATAESPLQVHGASGIGKTALLRRVASGEVGAPDGVVLLSTRRRDFDEIAAKLYTAFWESSPPYLPTPAEIEPYLSDREALILLDDCGLDRDDVEALLGLMPRSTFVLGCERQTLWARGSAQALGGLDPAEGVRLVELRLGRQLADDERTAAERLSARLGGEPQRLVEAAAAVTNGHATLAALAGGVDADAPLTASERQLVATLDLLDGAPLGAERIASLTEIPDAPELLAGLEQRGWVKSASPRYRLVREPAVDTGTPRLDDSELYYRLLDELILWSGRQPDPASVAAESEAIEATLGRSAHAGHWKQALELARAAEPRLAGAGAWVSWRRVLSTGLKSARMVESPTAEARMLHQLGSLELCLGERDRARTLLEQALELRNDLGEETAAALTRHNLDQLGGGGGDDSDDRGDPGGGSGTGGFQVPALGAALAVVAVVAAVIALIALGGGDEATPEPAGGQGVQVGGGGSGGGSGSGGGGANGGGAEADDAPPEILVTSPVEGQSYERGSSVTAVYSCTDSGSGIELCEGTVPDGDPVETDAGPHVFEVRARDRAGNETTRQISYTVGSVDPEPPPAPGGGTSDGASGSADPDGSVDYGGLGSTGPAPDAAPVK